MSFHHSVKGAFHFRHAPHPWEKATGAALTMGVCVLIGALFGHVAWGLLATVGGFSYLYANDERYPLRAFKLPLISLGLALALALGTLFAGKIWTMACTLSLVSMIATFISGALRIRPPGGYFFVLVCALGTGLPPDPSQAPLRFGLAIFGGAVAWIVSMSGWWLFAPKVESLESTFPFQDHIRTAWKYGVSKNSGVIPATFRIGVAVLLATFVAFLLGNPRPYWVPMTCASVLQGATFVATAQRTLQRALGTALGVVVAGVFLSMHPPLGWLIVGLMVFQWFAEMMIVRNYGLAVIFITPLPLILAETGYPELPPEYMVQARLLDTLLGCFIGVLIASVSWRLNRAR